MFKINRQNCRTLLDFSIGGIIFRSSVTLHFLVLVDISVGKVRGSQKCVEPHDCWENSMRLPVLLLTSGNGFELGNCGHFDWKLESLKQKIMFALCLPLSSTIKLQSTAFKEQFKYNTYTRVILYMPVKIIE